MTFFAPNTAEALVAFINSTAGTTQPELNDAFNYYIAKGVAYSSTFKNGTELQTIQGDNVTISIVGNETFVNGARIIQTDFLVANDVIHLIDNILDRFNTSLPNTNPSPRPTPTGSAIIQPGSIQDQLLVS